MLRVPVLIVLAVTFSLTSAAPAFDVVLGPESPLTSPSVAPAPYGRQLSGIASNGRDFLAIWLDRRSAISSLPLYSAPAAAYLSRLDVAGRPLIPFGSRLRDGVTNPAIVRTSAGYTLLWSENGETFLMLLDDDGVAASAPKRIADGYLVAAASNGRTIFIIHGPLSQPQFASVLGTDGTALSRTPLDAGDRYPQWMQPMVTADGRYAFVTQRWKCPGNVGCTVTATLTTVTESGAVAARELAPLTQWTQSAAAIGNGRILLAWMSDSGSPARRLAFRIFDPDGNPLTAETTIASTNDVQSASGSYAPTVGWDGQEFLVAWQWPLVEGRTGEIRAMRVTGDGIMIDGAPMILSSTQGNPPRFASNGSSHLVAWDSFVYQSSGIAVRSVASFDTLNYAATSTMPMSAALQTQVQLASLGSKTLAVWREGDSNPSIVGTLSDSVPIVVSAAGTLDQQVPAVGASNGQYLVVWREQAIAPSPPQTFRILGRRISPDGHVLDSDPIVIAQDPVPYFVPGVDTLAVGSNGTDFFVIWPSDGDLLRGVRVSAAGAVLDTAPIAVSAPPNGTPGSPRVVWNGQHYVVAWIADPSCKICLSPLPPVSQVFVARVTSGGQLADSQKIWLGGYGPNVALAHGNNGFLLAWAAVDSGGIQNCVHTVALRDDGVPNGPIHDMTCAASGWPFLFPDLDAAWDGASFVIAWTRIMGSSTKANAMRVSAAGAPLDGAPFDLSAGDTASFQAALASSPDGVLVAYDRIALEPQYGGVARIFARSLSRLNLLPRRRATH
ncbi:MAG TPA: hypothetical protein VEZ11_12585 [Thermoanaerobaculia bacterium]|nr:hypothetical protein [Thermoanaerobaculia bacterium]